MEPKVLKALIKVCRENGIKELEANGFRLVFLDSALTAHQNNPVLRKPRRSNPLLNKDVPILPKGKVELMIDDSDSLMIDDPVAYEEFMISGVSDGN